ncbi:MAG TPA: hypothetical protein VK563_06050 [Puia sp.]|nr:hypothetical protein [Puia sp.]
MILLVIKFEFGGREYSALARVKEKDKRTEYAITVMNGELEQLLYGNHVIIEEDGEIRLDLSPDTEVGRLKCIIAKALNVYIRHAAENKYPQSLN